MERKTDERKRNSRRAAKRRNGKVDRVDEKMATRSRKSNALGASAVRVEVCCGGPTKRRRCARR